jgi:hypothetical protein
LDSPHQAAIEANSSVMQAANAAPANMARRLPGLRNSALSPPHAAAKLRPAPVTRDALAVLADAVPRACFLDVAVLRADMETHDLSSWVVAASQGAPRDLSG